MVNVVDMKVMFGASKPSGGGTTTPKSQKNGLQKQIETCQAAGDGRFIQDLDCSGHIITRVIHPSEVSGSNTVDQVGVSDPSRRLRVVDNDPVGVSDSLRGSGVSSPGG